MDIVIGRGNRRDSITIATGPAVEKEVRERTTFAVQKMLHARGVIPSLK